MEEKSVQADKPATPSPAGKKGGKKLIIIGCVLGICGLVTLCLIGLVLAFFSNTSIPFFSSAVEKGENVVTTDDQAAQYVQDDMKDMVFSTILSMSQSNDYSGVVDVTATQAEIENMIKDKNETEAARFDGKASIVDNTVNMALDFNGFYNKSDLKSDFDGTLTSQGVSLGVTGEVRAKSEGMYVKLSEFPSAALGMPALDSIVGQWIGLTSTDVASTTSGLTGATGEPTKIGKADLDKIAEFIDSDEVAKNIKRLDDEDIEGVRTNCFEMDLDQTEMMAILKKASELAGDSTNTASLAQAVSGFTNIKLVACSGRMDGNIYKVVIETSTPASSADAASGATTMKVEMKLWDYDNVSDTVEMPTNVVPFEQIVGSLMSSFLGTGGTTPPVTAPATIPDLSDYGY